MRVIAGAFKGRRLLTPRGARTRPTADQVRIALMDTLAPWLSGARFLDLFAGTGGVGLEALSRGAVQATFVERDARAIVALRKNVAALEVESRARILRMDVNRAIERLAEEGAHFEIIFVDPPYEAALVEMILAQLGRGALTAPDGIVVAQHLTKRTPASTIGGFEAFRGRRFGETTLTFFRAGEYDSPA